MKYKEGDYVFSDSRDAVFIQGVYECFATGKMTPQLTTIPFEEIDIGLEKLKNHEVKGRLVAVFE